MSDQVRGVVIRLPLFVARVNGTPDELRKVKTYLGPALVTWSSLTAIVYLITLLQMGLSVLLGGPLPSDRVLYSTFILVALVTCAMATFGTLTARDTALALLPHEAD